MLDPVVLPIPVALAVVTVLAFVYSAATFLARPDTLPALPAVKPARPGPGRHRLTLAVEPYRPAATVARPVLSGVVVIPGGVVADWRQPLTAFEKRVGAMVIAGHDDHEIDWSGRVPSLVS